MGRTVKGLALLFLAETLWRPSELIRWKPARRKVASPPGPTQKRAKVKAARKQRNRHA